MMMKRHLQNAHCIDTKADKAWLINEFIESEARHYNINKSKQDRDTDDKVVNLLARRFGVGSNWNLIQRPFQDKKQKFDE